jgi:hypothetical protein
MVPTPNPPVFIWSLRRRTVIERQPFFGPRGLFGKALAGVAARRFTLRAIQRLACGTLALALGCSPSSVDEKKNAEPLTASNAAAVEKNAASAREMPAPDLRPAPPLQPATPVSELLPADVPVYPDGSITKTETGPDGAILLLSTLKSWENLRDFYTSSLLRAGWTPVPAAVPGQTLARFEKDGRVLVIDMQPGRQDEKLVRILYTTNSTREKLVH